MARSALAVLAQRGIDDFRIGLVQAALADSLVLRGRAGEALPLLQRAFRLAEPNGAGPALVLPLAEAAILLGRPADAACLLGGVLANPDDVDDRLTIYTHDRIERLRRTLAATLGPALDGLLARGAALPLRQAAGPLLG